MLKAANNAQSTLAQAINATATSFSVIDGSSFPDSNFLLSANDEIMLVGTRSGNTFSSVTRGHEGTTAAAHVSGTAVENRFTAGTHMELVEALIAHMPISGGILENYREKLTTLTGTSTTINLLLGNVFTHTLSGNTTYTISNAVSGQAHSFTLIINMGSTVRTLTFPASVKWQGGEIPDMTTLNKTYVLTFMTVDGGTNWLGMFGGEF